MTRNKNNMGWGFYILSLYLILALLSSIIANDKPIVCNCDGNWNFPVFAEWKRKNIQQSVIDFSHCTHQMYPPVKYKPESINPEAVKALPPGYKPSDPSKGKHWLGTDRFGRDVAAGLIYGTRTALLVGGATTALCMLLGVSWGMTAGYFGNKTLKCSLTELLVFLIAAFTALFYGIFEWRHGTNGWLIAGWFLLPFPIFAIFTFVPYFRKNRNIRIPLDLILMKIIELRKSIPALFFILATLSLFKYGSIYNVVIIAALLGWVEFARYARAETMKVSSENYILNARVLGYSNFKIIKDYIFPNIIPTLMVVACFSAGGFILLESTLSFLGIGIPVEEVSWGKMLAQGRDMKAWWLVVFPGMTLFILIWVLNHTAQKLQEQ